jgi:predicted ATP-dependent endonuclease of OLD family
MQLTSFRVTNYRSVNDSGDVDVAQITAILGRNESGKTNLLRALTSLNPPGGIIPLNPVRDFPKHRRLNECTDDTVVLATTWTLSPEETEELAGISSGSGMPKSKDRAALRQTPLG